ncbi:triacylglycerol lipase [Cryptococcus wingfieldii CBS 7118]|uniref:Triacylglycerol lipase n=1 Tax=Cryptococcus wingfieldii CBS 7118 TaxID=1295528 RepID=A0A1E3JIV7_9TREE|nr:triacylglycerol lipase [Cryptococcus wingfieldii CBS 7118]ODO00810.1 triacylglycerol lipase [Cryptococcus wingfieldii CBS 7118]
MGTTLSPFRYLQLARYCAIRWADNFPAYRKSKTALARAHAKRYLKRAGEERKRWEGLVKAGVVEPSDTESKTSFDGSAAHDRASANHGQAQDPHGHNRDPKKGHPHQNHHKHQFPHSHRFPKLAPDPKWPAGPKEIFNLMNDERLFVKGAAKPPREVIVLCHGLYGFSTATPIPLFPSLKLHYWASVLEVLRDKMGCEVVVVGVKGTGSVQERADQMHEFLKTTLPKGTGVNFVAHSMGGLDCRHLISNIKPHSYTPLSLTTIGTPHRGSPFMDWCAANIGVGSAAAVATAALTSEKVKNLPYSLKSPLLSRPPPMGSGQKPDAISSFAAGLTSYLLSIFDSPAYANLTTSYLRDHFNPATPDSPSVKYTSVAGRCSKMSVLHPLWFPKLVLDAAAENGYAEDTSNFIFGPDGKPLYEGNDGLVSVSSAKWGEFLGAVDECHHWDLRGEGGLFPGNSAITLGDAVKKGEAKKAAGWDLEGDQDGFDEHLGLAAREKKMMEIERTEMKKAGKAGEHVKPSKHGESSILSPSTWDLAQVGQVVDWATDYLPGSGDKEKTEVGKRQMAAAKQEKEDAERELEEGEPVENGKARKDQFDLERFYGGLMLKLRDDGF